MSSRLAPFCDCNKEGNIKKYRNVRVATQAGQSDTSTQVSSPLATAGESRGGRRGPRAGPRAWLLQTLSQGAGELLQLVKQLQAV